MFLFVIDGNRFVPVDPDKDRIHVTRHHIAPVIILPGAGCTVTARKLRPYTAVQTEPLTVKCGILDFGPLAIAFGE